MNEVEIKTAQEILEEQTENTVSTDERVMPELIVEAEVPEVGKGFIPDQEVISISKEHFVVQNLVTEAVDVKVAFRKNE